MSDKALRDRAQADRWDRGSCQGRKRWRERGDEIYEATDGERNTCSLRNRSRVE